MTTMNVLNMPEGPLQKQEQEEEQEEDAAVICCICSGGDNLITTKCGHQLHLTCMLQWCEQKVSRQEATTCPICRAVLLPVREEAQATSSVPVRNISTQRFIRSGHTGAPGVLQPLLTAVVHEEIDQMVAMLLRNVQHSNPHDEMMDAICSGNIEDVESSIIAQPDIVNSRREDGTTVLHHAIYRQHIEILDLLLSNHANPRLADRFGMTALHAAVTVGSVPCARRLMGKGACVEAADRNGETALFYALRAKDVAMVSLLLRKRADVNAENRMGNTVLHLLAQGEFPHNMTALLRQAEPRCLGNPNYIGDTPLHIAVEKRNLDFIRKFKHIIPFHSRFITNHIGYSPEDYMEDDATYDGIRYLFSQWQRSQHEDESLRGSSQVSSSSSSSFSSSDSGSSSLSSSTQEAAIQAIMIAHHEALITATEEQQD